MIWSDWWFQLLGKIWKWIGVMTFPIYAKIRVMFQSPPISDDSSLMLKHLPFSWPFSVNPGDWAPHRASRHPGAWNGDCQAVVNFDGFFEQRNVWGMNCEVPLTRPKKMPFATHRNTIHSSWLWFIVWLSMLFIFLKRLCDETNKTNCHCWQLKTP